MSIVTQSYASSSGLSSGVEDVRLVGGRPAMNERQLLLKVLRKQTATLSNMRHLFPKWSWDVHPDLGQVSIWVDDWLAGLNVATHTKQRHRSKGNYVLSAAAYYPDATPEKLLVLTQFQYWIFFWDDEIDTGGRLASDTYATLEWCRKTKSCIDGCLQEGLDATVPSTLQDLLPIIAMLCPILLNMRREMAPVSCERLRIDLHEFVDGVIKQQRIRLDESLPLATANLKMRAEDIGVKPCITQIEYAMDVCLPSQIYSLQSVQRILHLSSTMTVLVNELASFQKEAKDGQVENFVLLLANEQQLSLQEAINQTVSLLIDHYREFCTVEEEILQNMPESSPAVVRYIACAKAIVTGTTAWSYDCGRYFKRSQIDESGDVLVCIDFKG